jgi:hypothetical protein
MAVVSDTVPLTVVAMSLYRILLCLLHTFSRPTIVRPRIRSFCANLSVRKLVIQWLSENVTGMRDEP